VISELWENLKDSNLFLGLALKSSCGKKYKYGKASAKAEKDKMAQKYKITYETYRCIRCSKYHIRRTK